MKIGYSEDSIFGNGNRSFLLSWSQKWRVDSSSTAIVNIDITMVFY